MFFGCSSIKFAQIIPLCWTRCQQELKTEKGLMTSSSKKQDRFGNNFAGIFHGWPSNKIAENHFAPLYMMAAGAKNRQTLKQSLNSYTDLEII